MDFFEKHQLTFQIVVRFLGEGWRINLLDNRKYRIKLTSSLYPGYSIIIRQEKQRLNIFGGVDSRYWRSPGAQCTVALNRKPESISLEIKNKILPTARHEIEMARVAEKNMRKEAEEIQILKNMLSRLVHLENWHNTLTGFKAENGLSGSVKKQGGSYQIKIEGLNTDQIVKLTGILTKI